MKKLVLKGTRKRTLEDKFNNLQQIKYNWKTGKQGDEKRPLKNKNYTIKELKTINEDAKKEYNVYRKFILVTQSSDKDKTRLAYDEEMKILLSRDLPASKLFFPPLTSDAPWSGSLRLACCG